MRIGFVGFCLQWDEKERSGRHKNTFLNAEYLISLSRNLVTCNAPKTVKSQNISSQIELKGIFLDSFDIKDDSQQPKTKMTW